MPSPNFYVVIDSIPIDAAIFKLPMITSTFYLVQFTVQNLENPTAEPIGVYSYAGIKRYVWRDRFWAEYDVSGSLLREEIATQLRDSRDRDEAITLRKLLDLLHDYSRSVGPTSQDTIDNPNSAAKTFYRIIYEIKKG
jgi:hypothetical protein